MKYKIWLIWRILTRNDWFIINKTPPTRPFELHIGDIIVLYPEDK